MKASKYNIILEEDDGGVLLFNCISCSFTRLNKENYDCYLKIISHDPCINVSDPKTKTLIEDLKVGCFIVDEFIDELSMLKFKHESIRFAKNHMTITILPTTACNFKCKYCFEGFQKHDYLSRELEDCIYKYVDDSLTKGGRLRVTWFGGEPGLAIDSVYRLSQKFFEMSLKKNIIFSSLCVTNGYSINRDVAAKLVKYGLNAMQITLDGPREVHNMRRPLKNGSGTYDTIINNLKDIAGIIPIYLRTNIDKDNVDCFPRLLDELEENGLRENVIINIGNTTADTDACYVYKNNIFNIHDYSEVIVGLYELLVKRKFKIDAMIPSLHFVNCSSICSHGFFIYANGDIYKCVGFFGHESECIGNIRNSDKLNNNLAKWLAWDPFSNEYCRDCTIFPFCRGGCPSNWICPSEYLEFEDRCVHWKYTLPQLLRLQYQSLKENIFPNEGVKAGSIKTREENTNETVSI